MQRLFPSFLPLLSLLVASVAMGQGVLIETHQHRRLPRPWPQPEPQTSYKIEALQVQARVKDQTAQVQVSQTFVNTGRTQMEVQFVFPLPYDGAIDQMTLLVDGEELPAELLPRDKAREKYEAIVRSSKDPALLEWIGNGLFQTSVFPVPPGKERTVTLNYSQLLRKSHGVTDFLFPLSAAKYSDKPVEKVSVRVTIDSTIPIRNIYSPSHDVEIDKSGRKQAVVKFEATDSVPASDFRLFFDVNPKKVGTSVLSYRPEGDQEGYFLLLTTPQIPDDGEEVPKTVIFVVDKSGSMSGEKIEQAKGALKFVLNNLKEGDVFNIVAYDSSVESFRPELEKFNNETRQAALGYVEGLYAGGGTNIHDALSMALKQLQDEQRPSFVIFLTDGLPTVGERNEAKIAEAARKANDVRARLLNFGVGYDVNSRLLDRIAAENFGASEYVRPEEDIEAHVSKVYRRIASPVLTDVEIKFEMDGARTEDGNVISRVYPSGKFDLFGGEQMAVVGRYRKPGAAKVVISGEVNGEQQSFDFKADLVKRSDDQSFAFVAKLWAMRRIGEIIDELDLHGKNEELTKELIALSTKHGILTEYTSFLADENTRPTELAGSSDFSRNLHVTGERLESLRETEGRGGVAQRSAKQDLKQAQRFSYGAAPATASGPEATPSLGLSAGASQGAVYRDAESDRLVVTESVRQVGQQTLYKRGKILCTPETAELFSNENGLKLELDKLGDKVQVVERFSEDYFRLVAANTAAENQLLSSQLAGEELLVNLRGQAYLIR